jgi:hypothetical protein
MTQIPKPPHKRQRQLQPPNKTYRRHIPKNRLFKRERMHPPTKKIVRPKRQPKTRFPRRLQPRYYISQLPPPNRCITSLNQYVPIMDTTTTANHNALFIHKNIRARHLTPHSISPTKPQTIQTKTVLEPSFYRIPRSFQRKPTTTP